MAIEQEVGDLDISQPVVTPTGEPSDYLEENWHLLTQQLVEIKKNKALIDSLHP